MEQHSGHRANQHSSRQEKLSILSAILGPEAMAKLHAEQNSGASSIVDRAVGVDPQRAEWHRNRLLERFRTRTEGSARANEPRPSQTEYASSTEGRTAVGSAGLEERISRIGKPSDLAMEHPAIIAHILGRLSRADRVDALKTLPGPVARAVVRRIR